MACCHDSSVYIVGTDADTKLTGAQDTVHSEPDVDGTAPETVQIELHCLQQASRSELIVDSDSVYSICCSDVTSDEPDIVHVDQQTPPTAAAGTSTHFILSSLNTKNLLTKNTTVK